MLMRVEGEQYTFVFFWIEVCEELDAGDNNLFGARHIEGAIGHHEIVLGVDNDKELLHLSLQLSLR
jgi:hypothetical protein